VDTRSLALAEKQLKKQNTVRNGQVKLYIVRTDAATLARPASSISASIFRHFFRALRAFRGT
jgi:hypothetical protein